MKKISVLLVLCMIIGCLGGCAGTKNDDISNPVVEAIEGVKTFNIDKMCQYFDMEKSDFDGLIGNYREFIISTFGKLEYKVDEINKSSDTTAKVKVSVTVIDIPTVISDAMKVIMQNVANFQGKDSQEVAAFLADCMMNSANKPDVKKNTNMLEIPVNKKDGKWVPEFSDDDVNILFGDIDSVKNIFR